VQLPYEETIFEDSLDVHGVAWVVVFSYFDETGMHGDAPDTIVSGYLFSKDGVKLFRQLFNENVSPLLPLDKHGRRMYHSTKCIGGHGDFSSLLPPERERIVDLLAESIVKSVTLGVVVGMEKQEYEKALAKNPPLRELAGDPYSVCLIRCIENMCGWIEESKIEGRIQYVFEAGCEHQKEANVILGRISQSEELKRRYRWHHYSFIEKSPEVPQLFAPDLLAWEWQRARLNALKPQRKEWRLTLKKLTHGKPHIASYQTATSVGIRALVNSTYGLTRIGKPFHVSI
jgi:hypothetical protein